MVQLKSETYDAELQQVDGIFSIEAYISKYKIYQYVFYRFWLVSYLYSIDFNKHATQTTDYNRSKFVRGNLEKFFQFLEQEGVAQQFSESIQEAWHLITTLDPEFDSDRAGPKADY